MPNSIAVVGAPVQNARSLSMSFLDWRGKQRASNLTVPTAATDAELIAVATAAGNGSNAALVERHIDLFARVLNVTDPLIEAYDEAYDNVGTVAVFQFQNDVGDIQTLEIPAPDASLFLPDGVTINIAAGLASAIATAAVVALNAGDPAGSYVYSRGYAAQRKVKTSKVPVRPGNFVEPAGGDLPPDAPGI